MTGEVSEARVSLEQELATLELGGRIVVGVDGSEESLAALRWAVHQARQTGARVEATLVYEPAPVLYFGVGGYPAVTPVDEKAARDRARLDLARAIVAAVGLVDDVAMVTVADQSPAKTLTRAAKGAQMLVVGAHRHHALGLLLGSTAGACVRHAVTPVVVVPTDAGTSSSGTA